MITDKTELYIQKCLPPAPKISAEIGLYFNYDFPVECLSKTIGLNPSEAQIPSLTRINPISGRHNSGYWIYHIGEDTSYDCKALFQSIEKLLSENVDNFTSAIRQYHPECILLRLYVDVEDENEYPSIRLHSDLLNLLAKIQASFDIVIENNYGT